MAISGYAEVLSVKPGGSLSLHVSTDAPKFRVEFYRLGSTLAGPLAGVPAPDLRDGQNLPPASPRVDWGWPAYSFTIPPSWQTGVYVAMLVEVDASGADLAGQPLGGPSLDGAVAVAMNADGRLEVFARGSDGAIWHLWQTAPSNGWGPWHSLGGGASGMAGRPAIGVNADGRLEVFARGNDGALWHAWQVSPNGGWSTWFSEGGQLDSEPAVACNADGRLEVLARSPDGALWRFPQSSRNNGWSSWLPLGGTFVGDPVVAANADGRLEVFLRGPERALWHRWQYAPGDW